MLVYPGGGILPIRAWPLASYTALCEGLVADGCAVAVIGLKDDQALARQLVANVQASFPASPVIDLTGYTRSISELLALFHGAAAGHQRRRPRPVQAALTPIWTLMLFGPETPSLYAPLTPRCHSFYSQWPLLALFDGLQPPHVLLRWRQPVPEGHCPAAVLAKARECWPRPEHPHPMSRLRSFSETLTRLLPPRFQSMLRWRFIKFGLVGGSGTVINIVLPGTRAFSQGHCRLSCAAELFDCAGHHGRHHQQFLLEPAPDLARPHAHAPAACCGCSPST